MRPAAVRTGERSVPAALAIGLALGVAACGGGDGGAAGGGAGNGYVAERNTAGTVETVRVASGSEWGTAPTLIEELAIGEETGEEPYLFGSVTAAWATRDRIYAVDGQAPAVRAYDTNGKFLFVVGHKGQGPGEYSQPLSLAVTDDGRVLVSDLMGARLNIYDADGQPLEDWPLGSPQAATGVELTLDGEVFTRVVKLPTSMADFNGSLRMGMQAVGPDGLIGDPVYPPEIDFEPPTVTISMMGQEMKMPLVPFAPSYQWIFAPGGEMIVGVGNAYRFEIHHPDGNTTIVEKYWDPVAVATAEGAFRGQLAAQTVRQLVPDFTIDADLIPATKPAFNGFIADRSGRLWVVREGPGRPDPDCAEADRAAGVALAISRSGPSVMKTPGESASDDAFPDGCWIPTFMFDVFAINSGDFLGTVSAPEAGFRAPLFVDGDTVLASVTDDIGTVRLKLYRLQAGGD